MRRRLLLVALTLLTVLLIALTAPLISTYASDRTQDFFVSRLGDVTRFSVLAADGLETGQVVGLDADLERYAQVYGGTVLVTNANREVVASAGDRTTAAQTADAVGRALSGAGSQPPDTVWPWSRDQMVIASPVGRDAQVLGAVVLVAPTSPVQSAVTWGLVLLLLGGLAAVLLTAYGVVVPFVGWILRPVGDLDAAAKRLAGGDLASRAHQAGPPELRDLARSFNVMADNVETSQRQQRELVADAAHQLGNPLTALRLRIEALSATAESGQVEPALEEADRLHAIVDSLLRLSRVGGRHIVPERIDVAALARHRCEMWGPVFADLSVETPETAPAMATPDVIDVTLDALLDNAAKFAPGSPVSVRVRLLGDGVALQVADHGPGLHPDDAAKVGDRFFRGRQHQNVPGTGLGLAIVRARVEDLGGQLHVASPDGGGLAVEVRLPPPRSAAPGSNAPPQDGAAGER